MKFFQAIFVNPFLQAIHGIAILFNDNYGISIIIITLIIRLILMPFMLKQYKNQQLLKTKMENIKPEMATIQEKIKNTKDKQEERVLQQELISLYSKHGINPLNMGCLPLLIQMPILMGLYYAIRGSHEIATHSFLWFSLGQPDIGITLIAGIVYFVQIKVTQSSFPIEQQKQMKFMGFLYPIMIIMISMNAPAALPLYWAVGGIYLVLQSLLSKKLYHSSLDTKATSNDIG